MITVITRIVQGATWTTAIHQQEKSPSLRCAPSTLTTLWGPLAQSDPAATGKFLSKAYGRMGMNIILHRSENKGTKSLGLSYYFQINSTYVLGFWIANRVQKRSSSPCYTSDMGFLPLLRTGHATTGEPLQARGLLTFCTSVGVATSWMKVSGNMISSA